MIRSLLRKELRDQRPFLALVLVLELLELAAGLFTGDFARLPLGVVFLEAYSELGAALLFLIAFALGTGLLTREREERTLEFLDALPIGRTPLFCVKVAIGWLVLMAGPVLELVVFVLRHQLYPSSLEPDLHLGLLVTGMLLQGAVIYVGLAAGVILSFAGRLSWLLLLFAGLAVYLTLRVFPAASALNPAALIVPDFQGEHWRLPTVALLTQLSLGTLALLLAMALFSGSWDRLLRSLWEALSGAAATPIAAITALVGFLCLALLVGTGGGGGGGGGDEGLFWPQSKTAQFSSAHYDFLYPAELADRAAPLFDHADETWSRVREVLGTSPEGRLPVDLTGSAQHTSGMAFWNTIRMNLIASGEGDELRSTLAHETTHVFASLTVGPERAMRLGQMRTFGEGLALYVERQLFPTQRLADAGRLAAAILHERKQLRVDDLIDASSLATTQDANLVYPFGELLVERLVHRYGRDAPKKLLEALGREDAPETLAPLAVWQDAFQSAGFDLPRVLYDVQTALAQERRRPGAPQGELVRPRPVLEEAEEGAIEVKPVLSHPPPEGWEVVCRFRTRADTPFTEYDGPYTLTEEAGCLRYRAELERSTLWVQLGLMAPGGYAVYEPWVSFPVK